MDPGTCIYFIRKTNIRYLEFFSPSTDKGGELKGTRRSKGGKTIFRRVGKSREVRILLKNHDCRKCDESLVNLSWNT